ncbi:MAG: (Fe-S)-binding protein [Desulfamplus sp.]|nr:(Fe-S)-binding protein [Desulfamplus sp.]
MYNPKYMIDAISNNVRTTKNPFGIPKFLLNRWHLGVKPLARSGDSMLFTGLMYQFSPYIEKSTEYLAQFEDSKWQEYLKFAKYVPGYLSGSGLWLIALKNQKKEYDTVLQNIVRILRASHVDFFYRPELDDYSGILLYDLGDQDAFIRHARYVAKKLKRAGIKRLITVDPHTTYALKVLFPKYTGISFDVKPYFELINFRSQKAAHGKGTSSDHQKEGKTEGYLTVNNLLTVGIERITLHDPCFYGRYLEVSDTPRRVLANLDIECANIRNSGTFTSCCGGPAESISPKLSSEIADRRLNDLNTTGDKIIAFCPICLGNLRKSGAKVDDLANLIASKL